MRPWIACAKDTRSAFRTEAIRISCEAPLLVPQARAAYSA
jgi:hypothetical protein